MSMRLTVWMVLAWMLTNFLLSGMQAQPLARLLHGKPDVSLGGRRSGDQFRAVALEKPGVRYSMWRQI